MDRQMWDANVNILRDIHQLPGAAATWRLKRHLISRRFQAFYENFVATGEGKPLYDEVTAQSKSSGENGNMSLGDLANLGQIIGAIAVVISLFYVAYQIRQNTNAVRSATAQAVHEHFAKWYHLLAADGDLSQIAANGLRDYASLSEQEKTRFIATFMAFLSYSQNAFLKWRQGLLASALWMGWELLIMNLICAPGGRAFWKERSYLFGEEFRQYVESDLMKRPPHPNAKPMGAFSIGSAR